jgi:hypothetical protein
MKNYRKFKWFFTSSGKLVVGGKSAESNDDLLREFKKLRNERIVMHTSHPGSPFCIIDCETSDVSRTDLSECARFCGSFSRAWKLGLRKTEVHIFLLSQISKMKGMKAGTWSVKGKVKNVKVPLELFLVKQEVVYRGVPFSVSDGVRVIPGKIDKVKMFDKLKEALHDSKVSRDELMAALPAGGIRICK